MPEGDSERRFCACGWSSKNYEVDVQRHNESGEHSYMVKVNALRDAQNRIDAIVEQSLQEGEPA